MYVVLTAFVFTGARGTGIAMAAAAGGSSVPPRPLMVSLAGEDCKGSLSGLAFQRQSRQTTVRRVKPTTHIWVMQLSTK